METLTVEFQPDRRLSKNGLRKGHWRTTQPLIKQAREDAYILGLIDTPKRCALAALASVNRKAREYDPYSDI